MEKIIAVVVMIAIVIGLIATAVLPMVNSMNEQGEQANNQLSSLTSTMTGEYSTGATVKAEIKSYLNKFNLTGEKLDSITIVPAANSLLGGTITIDSSSDTDLSTALTKIADNGIFTRTQTTYPSGTVRTITYTEAVK